MTTRHRALIDWLNTLPRVENATAVVVEFPTLAIPREFIGAHYTDVYVYDTDNMHVQLGRRNVGDQDRIDVWYLLGKLPTELGIEHGIPSANVAFAVAGFEHELYLACWADLFAVTNAPQYHPFGRWFQLRAWTADQLIDWNEPTAYRRVPTTITEVTV